jgi:hypothetical protein
MTSVRIQDDIFTYVTDNDLQQTIRNTTDNQQVIPLNPVSLLNPLKIHVSLNYIEYKKHRATLLRIIEQAIDNKIINHFKYVDERLFERKCRLIHKLDPLIPGLKAYAETGHSSHDQSSDYDHDKLLKLYRLYKNDESLSLPEKETVPPIIKKIEEKMLTTLRFLVSDQITIYLSAQISLDAVAKLCCIINEYLYSHAARAGFLTPNAVRISRYINLRQDYLANDPNRIDAILFDKTNPLAKKRCDQLKSQIRASELFQQLKQSFAAKKSISQSSKFLQSESMFSVSSTNSKNLINQHQVNQPNQPNQPNQRMLSSK